MILTIPRTTKNLSLAALAGFSISLLAFRMGVTQTFFYGFLVWNLFLSAVPLYISTWLSQRKAARLPVPLLFTSIWLLFLPNAPYIITDFLHFRRESQMPGWFDVLLLSSFSMTGIVYGFTSMADMHRIWDKVFGIKAGWLLIFSCAILTGFGIYLGRFLRFNSWDIISDPIDLLISMFQTLDELSAVGFTIGYGIFFFLFYVIFKTNSTK